MIERDKEEKDKYLSNPDNRNVVILMWKGFSEILKGKLQFQINL